MTQRFWTSAGCLLLCVAAAALGCDDGGGGDDDLDMAPEADGAGGEGGMGGEGGFGGEGGMGGMPDMGEPDEGAGGADGGPSMACVMACDRFLACAVDACEGDLGAACFDACAASPSFASVLGGIPACPDVVAFAAQQSAAIGAACDSEPPPPMREPLCDDFGARAGECLVEACAEAADLGPGASALFTDVCNEQVAAGNIQPGQLGGIRQAGCDHPIIAPVVQFITTDTGQAGSGGFIGLCRDGTQLPPETCDAACAYVRMCIPEGTPEGMGGALRDEPFCRLLCGVGVPEVRVESWACFAGSDNCAEIGQCLQNPPPIERPEADCGPFAARATECVAAACAPLAETGLDLAPIVELLCGQAVADGDVPPEVIEAVGPETPCEDEALTGAVQFFTVEDPEDPDAGLIAGICRGEGTANTAEQCDPACEQIAPCIRPEFGPDAQPFGDLETCRSLCRITEEFDADVLACVVAAGPDACPEVLACFPGR